MSLLPVSGALQSLENAPAVHSYPFEFHPRIAYAARCRTLRQMNRETHVVIFNWLFDGAASRPALPPRFQRDLVNALNRGDVETANRAMRQHVRDGLDSIVEILGARAKDVPFERAK